MKNAPQIFKNEEFGKITTIEKDGEPWFIGKEVAGALGYADSKKAIKRHCKYAELLKGDAACSFTKSPFGIKIIPEKDLYRLIMKSELPSAERFQDWMMDEVLPAIRKTGGYIVDRFEDTPAEIMARAIKVADVTMKRRAERIKVLEIQNKEMKPKALFADAVTSSNSSILIGRLAKLLKQNGIDMGQNRLFAYLRQNGFLIKKKGSDYNMPTQKSMEQKLLEINERIIVTPGGSVRVVCTTKVTGKGQQFFINLFLNKESLFPEAKTYNGKFPNMLKKINIFENM